jgi:ribosome-associated protein
MRGLSFDISTLEPWLEYRFSQSSGPGGQHVNKVATRATLLFDFEACDRLSDWQKERIRQRLKRNLSADGRLQVVRQSERSQLANRRAAANRLMEMLKQAFAVQRPRRATKPTKASRERRVKRKKQRGETKRLRQRPPRHDD